jgi:DNA-binding CsgD family transcriptional regulator
MARLRARGLSLAEIGRRLGVSRQCVQYTLHSMGRRRSYSVPCAGCGGAIVSDGALPSDAGAALCMPCLARQPEVSFAERLKALRLAAGMTKKELADRTGLSYEMVWHYEHGTYVPRRPRVMSLMRALGPGLVSRGPVDAT